MPIVINVDVMLAKRKMRVNELAERVGITPQNLSVLKTGRAKGIRFNTLEKICEVLDCQPGDLLAYEPAAAGNPGRRRSSGPPAAPGDRCRTSARCCRFRVLTGCVSPGSRP